MLSKKQEPTKQRVIDQQRERTDERNRPKEDTRKTMPTSSSSFDHEVPLIYSAPTTDSYGDESLLIKPYTVIQTPTRPRVGNFTREIKSAPPKVRSHVHTSRPLIKKQQQRRKRGPREFQNEQDFIKVSVQSVPIAQRSAFERNPPLSLEEWHHFAAAAGRNGIKRISPSLQHLELLHRMQSKTIVRQIQYSPPPDDVDLWPPDEETPESSQKRCRSYRSIDPVKATMAALPATAPVLSNKKTRLPTRADVGFKATEEEIRLKQIEIRNETEWEEASPRLCVLVTCDDLGRAVVEHSNEKDGGADRGIPYAGPDLIRAFARNAQYFGQPFARKNVKPNPYSCLAPPLDAIPSPSQGWRPRPFHDRPAGLEYVLACPTLELAISVEPLVCSLALYDGRGKTSEEFWFPAGNWESKIDIDAARREDGTVDESLQKAWLKRKQKAIFSYDPLMIKGGRAALTLVLQVYRLTQEGMSMYTTERRKIDSERIRQCADEAFMRNGTRLLIPFCYGCQKLYATHGPTKWPDVDSCEMNLYAFPVQPLTQEAFVSHLTALANEGGSLGQNEDSTLTVSEGLPSAPSETKKARGVSRLFRTPKVKGRKDNSSSHTGKEPSRRDSPIDGRACVFVSKLGSDFLQCMLSTPDTLDDEARDARLPRLLVDVSGDLAVLLDPSSRHASQEGTPSKKKKSNLLRLPVPTSPAGYVGSSEFREVLFLPTRPEKHYDVDTGLSYRSLLNMLYLYPRQLRLVEGDRKAGYHQFTLRARLLQTVATVDSEGGRHVSETTELPAFHSVAPWTGESLASECFTKVFGDLTDESSLSIDLAAGIPIRDELKLRLPFVLDGTIALEFELFALERGDATAQLKSIAQAVIPLSSSVQRDPSSSARVATIIPNGNHRLKLGTFQLQIETRLVSSVHVGDAATASFLRDYPCAKSALDARLQLESGLLLGSASSAVDSVVDIDETFPLLLSDASPGTVVCHFEVLLHMHLSNLVSMHDKSAREGEKATRFLTGNMLSLLEMLRTAKARFQDASGKTNVLAIKSFIKKHIDSFDEGFVSPASGPLTLAPSASEGEPDSVSEVNLANSSSQEQLDEEGRHEGAVRMISRPDRSTQHEMRVSRILDSMESAGLSFSRVAFGASKIDRMRIEAELRSQQDNLAHFFDDDETILTSPTLQSPPFDARTIESQHLFGGQGHISSDNSVVRAASSGANGHVPHIHHDGGGEFAQRVRTAAQVMLAPCVGPSLSNILAKSGSPRSKETSREEKKDDDLDRDSRRDDGFSKVSFVCASVVDDAGTCQKIQLTLYEQDSAFLCSPGSDGDDDSHLGRQESFEVSLSRSAGSAFRGPQDGPMLLFTVASIDGSEVPVACGEYLYESIMLLWLRAWLDHVEKVLKESNSTARPFATFALPEFDSRTKPGSSVFAFYAHMDFLLPLCLKSIVLRYSVEVLPAYPPSTRALLDESHMLVLEPFVEMLARGLVGQALNGLGSPEGREKAFLRSLESSELVLDFLVGLLGVVHPQHMNSVLKKFFRTLRDCETEHLTDGVSGVDFEWTEESLHRVRTSRQLRLRAIESLAVVPSFLALNYPPKYLAGRGNSRFGKATWRQQSLLVEEAWTADERRPQHPDGVERLPPSKWLAEMIISEALSVCSLSCEAVVAEAMAHEVTATGSSKIGVATSALKKRPGAALKRSDLLMFQSTAIHAITCVYELVVRRHAMDSRFQKDSSRERIAGLFAEPILEKSVSSVRWLARMESTHKVRSLWLLCFVYVLQEAPESLIRHYISSLCTKHVSTTYRYVRVSPDEAKTHSCVRKDVKVHRFIRMLRLCSSSFQSFVDLPRHATFPSEIDKGLSPWLLQESFNTICAATNIVVEECIDRMVGYPQEQEKMMNGVLDLLLYLLTTPQSSVTHLRAIGGALHALERFGVEFFFEIVGSNLQHWVRVILSLMNSTSLSVRSIAVDFVISLLGQTFDLNGNIDFVSIVFVSVLPEVVAREIGLYSVAGLVKSLEDISRGLWPLRRAIADLQDSNPLDDDRIDPQLSPVLTTFCRACQAVMDGVLIEMRLMGENAMVVGTRLEKGSALASTFDADEESLFEAATFFQPETSPMQRIRWLLTLKALHESKGQWVEAAEALYLCGRTISDSILHLDDVWRPSRFVFWSDARRSLWLETVGEDIGHPDRGNAEVMDFADDFLEPSRILGVEWKTSAAGKLQQPTVPVMSAMLSQVSKEAVAFYLREDGMDALAHLRVETLLNAVMNVLDTHSTQTLVTSSSSARRRLIEDQAALRRTLAAISGDLTQLAERLLHLAQSEPPTPDAATHSPWREAKKRATSRPQYVVVQISGKKPPRFLESTTLPAFLEFDVPCICRLPESIRKATNGSSELSTSRLCKAFAEPLLASLRKECDPDSVVLQIGPKAEPAKVDEQKTYLHVMSVDKDFSEKSNDLAIKSFFHTKSTKDQKQSFVEMKVAYPFPCAISRQQSVLTTEILPMSWKPQF